MAARATQTGVTFRRVEALSTLNEIVAQAVSRHATDQDYLGELSAWSGRQASPDGVPAQNVPPSAPGAPPSARVFAGPALAQATDAHPSEDAAVVVGLSTEADNAVDWLRAGEATSVVLLTATALGMASCPVSEPLEIVETRDQVRSELFGGEGFPQMLLRIGWAPINADPLPPTPRRPLSDVVVRLDGARFPR
jgi:nitroreductase